MGALRGSTLVEAVVASVIFMCVFAISLETVLRLTTKKEDNMVLIDVDHRIEECLRDYSRHENGVYAREYDWGRIVVVVRQYKNYPRLREVVVTANTERKRLEIRHVVEAE